VSTTPTPSRLADGLRADEHLEAVDEVVDEDRMVDKLTDQEDRRSRPGSWPSIDPG
jgi:hypothetical protein